MVRTLWLWIILCVFLSGFFATVDAGLMAFASIVAAFICAFTMLDVSTYSSNDAQGEKGE